MVEKEILKRAIIAGAAHAMDYKEKNPRASESEIMSHVTREMRKIIKNVEDEENEL